jgi:hypothetical protein
LRHASHGSGGSLEAVGRRTRDKPAGGRPLVRALALRPRPEGARGGGDAGAATTGYAAGDAWLQLVAAEPGDETGSGAVLRFGVAHLDAALTALAAAGAKAGDVERIPGVIAFCDVEDPFGNVLSLYEELGEC